MKIKFWLMLIFLLYTSVLYAYDYEWIEPLPIKNTWVNWTTYTISSSLNCTSSHDFPSYLWLKKKKIQLMNKLYNATLKIKIQDNLSFERILDPKSKILLWELINNSPNFSVIKTSQNSTLISLGLSITGKFLRNSLSLSFFLKSGDIVHVTKKVEDFLKEYTGVIIQINTPKFKPNLMLWIYSQNGELLFSPKVVDYEVFVRKGMALFLNSFNKDLISHRVGSRPIVLEANGIYKDNINSIVLDEDNSFYLRFESILDLLKQGKLVIIKKQYINYQKDNVNEFQINE